MKSPRNDLIEIYQAALGAVAADKVTGQWLEEHDLSNVSVIAIGKAASGMMQGAVHGLATEFSCGLVISAEAYLESTLWAANLPIEIVEGAHPVPDEKSLIAGKKLLAFVNNQAQPSKLLFLISGGASSMVDVLVDSINLENLTQLNEWLLASGLPINQMNQIRRRVSKLKGGGLLRYLGDRSATVLYISDVKDDLPAVVGSGLLYQSDDNTLPNDLPGWIEALCSLKKEVVIELENPPHYLVGSLTIALKAAQDAAEKKGYATTLNAQFIEGDALQQGHHLAAQLLNMKSGLSIYGGETTVKLPASPGKGGRNQHLCVAAAQVMKGKDNVYLLAAGSDGIDGNTADAGALVDGQTLRRASVDGFDADNTLECADSNSFLSASGDLLNIGATGTNVMDIILALKSR